MRARVIASTSPLLLGSASPRRRDILKGLGIPLVVSPADVAEEVIPGEAPLAYLERIVADKLRAVAPRIRETACAAALVADTTVVLDEQILGKPSSVEEAGMLVGRLAGRTHVVYTRYAVATRQAPEAVALARTVESSVTLRAASRDELAAYAATGEGLDKAGAYAIQGLGAFLVQRIEGSYTNVVGLPACELVLDFVALGLLKRFPGVE